MEPILLSALLLSQLPTCPKPFVKSWSDRHERPAEVHLPTKSCLLKTPTGAYVCNIKIGGCARP